MRRLSFRTAGESHGQGLMALVEGLPAGLALEVARDVDPELRRRQGGYGRGRRMLIEQDRALFEQLVEAAEAQYASAVGRARQQDLIRAHNLALKAHLLSDELVKR